MSLDAVRAPAKRGNIHDVLVTPLRQIPDERGKIMHMLRADQPHFEKFGEIYFATAYPGVIKGWHLHKRQTQNYCVVDGMIKLVLYDDRVGSPSRLTLQELFVGEDNYCLVTIPPGILNGWKAIGEKRALLANCATLVHEAGEMERRDPFDSSIPYNWELIHR